MKGTLRTEIEMEVGVSFWPGHDEEPGEKPYIMVCDDNGVSGFYAPIISVECCVDSTRQRQRLAAALRELADKLDPPTGTE